MEGNKIRMTPVNPIAARHLVRADPAFRHLVKKVGHEGFLLSGRRTPFESLVRAVAHQQLTGRVADVILSRFLQLYPKHRFPPPEAVLQTPIETLRSVGFSLSKALSIYDIARKTQEGVVPTSRQIRTLEDEAIIERLILIRGVGRWTAQMLLIFKLGRPDVLPADDFGVRKGFALLHGRTELPGVRELLVHGERWKPYRTAAAWYLWRAVEVL